MATKLAEVVEPEVTAKPAKPFAETLLKILRQYSRPVGGANRRFLEVRCVCGVVKEIYKDNLPRTFSCGCLSIRNATRHGQYKTTTYKSWQTMLARCLNQNTPYYHHYGGRGISVCQRWLKFENFLTDMSHRPDGKTLNRIDNDGGYEPGNCEWATRSEQMENTRQTRFLTVNGQTMSVNQWAIHLNVKRNTLYNRLFSGWTPERTILTPVGKRI